MMPRVSLIRRIWRAIWTRPNRNPPRTGTRDAKRAQATRELVGRYRKRQLERELRRMARQ